MAGLGFAALTFMTGVGKVPYFFFVDDKCVGVGLKVYNIFHVF